MWDKILLISQNAHEMRSADGGPTYTCQGQPAEPRGRFALGPRFVPNRSARIGTGAEPPHTREPAARCELRQLAVRNSPVMRLHQEEFCLTPGREFDWIHLKSDSFGRTTSPGRRSGLLGQTVEQLRAGEGIGHGI